MIGAEQGEVHIGYHQRSGRQCVLVPLKEYPRSIFFYERFGRLDGTDRGTLVHRGSGRTWKKVSEQLKRQDRTAGLRSASCGGLWI